MKTKLLLMLSVFASLFISSCSDDKDSDGTSTVSYAIEVKYPDAYQQNAATNITVKLKNLSNNREVTLSTDANGIAKFEGLAPGNYSVTASKELSASEAEPLTGYASEVFLNANISQLAILSEGMQTVQLQASVLGDWVIKEFYFSGAPDSYYFYDAYIEIFNNSTEVLYADGLLIGLDMQTKIPV